MKDFGKTKCTVQLDPNRGWYVSANDMMHYLNIEGKWWWHCVDKNECVPATFFTTQEIAVRALQNSQDPPQHQYKENISLVLDGCPSPSGSFKWN